MHIAICKSENHSSLPIDAVNNHCDLWNDNTSVNFRVFHNMIQANLVEDFLYSRCHTFTVQTLGDFSYKPQLNCRKS